MVEWSMANIKMRRGVRHWKTCKCKVSVAARMWCRALLLVLLTALSACGEGENDQEENNQLKVGRSIDIFTRFGYLSLTMKVVPRNESVMWIFREPTIDVFTDVEPYAIHARRSAKRQIFEGDFHMEFCDNIKQLLQAYFRDFNFERLDKPWKAFTASWGTETIAKHLGINASFVNKDHCFVLVRLSRFRDNVKLANMPNNVELAEVVAREIENIKVGDAASVQMFIRKYGSHYISSFVTGNALYQVFVYKKPTYQRIRDRLKTRGISHLENSELKNYFTPFYAVHMGAIKVASGNATVERWASTRLRENYFVFTIPSLLKIHGNTELLSVLNNLLQNEAILELEMNTLAPAFKDPAKRAWFEEYLDNVLKLWESNL